jgi:predicted nucleotide-binding protein
MTRDRAETVINLISIQLAALDSFKSHLDTRLPLWRNRTISLLVDHVFEGELEVLSKINTPTYEEDKKQCREFLVDLQKNIQNLPNYYLIPRESDEKLGSFSIRRTPDQKDFPISDSDSKRVFVVHGHDSLSKLEVTRFLENLGLKAIVLHEQPNEGRTIIEKFEHNAETVEFAVVLLTPDDSGFPANKPDEKRARARQNVVLELGYFCGALGRNRVCVLHKGDIEIPSDYLGVVYTPLDDSGAWKMNLAKELKRASFKIDMNRVI